jgi:hypothetical protein
VAKVESLFADVDLPVPANIAIVANAATAEQGTWRYRVGRKNKWIDVPVDLSDARAIVLPTSVDLRFNRAPNWSGTPGVLFVRYCNGNIPLPSSGACDISASIGVPSAWTADIFRLNLDASGNIAQSNAHQTRAIELDHSALLVLAKTFEDHYGKSLADLPEMLRCFVEQSFRFRSLDVGVRGPIPTPVPGRGGWPTLISPHWDQLGASGRRQLVMQWISRFDPLRRYSQSAERELLEGYESARKPAPPHVNELAAQPMLHPRSQELAKAAADLPKPRAPEAQVPTYTPPVTYSPDNVPDQFKVWLRKRIELGTIITVPMAYDAMAGLADSDGKRPGGILQMGTGLARDTIAEWVKSEVPADFRAERGVPPSRKKRP